VAGVALKAFVPELADLNLGHWKRGWKYRQVQFTRDRHCKAGRHHSEGLCLHDDCGNRGEARDPQGDPFGGDVLLENVCDYLMHGMSGGRRADRDVALASEASEGLQGREARMRAARDANIGIRVETLVSQATAGARKRPQSDIRVSGLEFRPELSRVHGYGKQTYSRTRALNVTEDGGQEMDHSDIGNQKPKFAVRGGGIERITIAGQIVIDRQKASHSVREL
jgi:hypothetical protein